MRAFYLAWFALCSLWGHQLTTLGASATELTFTFSPIKLLEPLLIFGAMFFAALWINNVPASEASLGFSRSPLTSWLAALQLVALTFVASGTWGLILVGLGVGGGKASVALGAAMLGAICLSSLWLACLVYRRVRRA